MTPQGHSDEPGQLISLGSSLEARFEHLGDISDIDEAILMEEMAIQCTSDVDPGKAGYRNCLGGSLRARFARLGEIADIKHAILNQEISMQLASAKQPVVLTNLATSLLTCFLHLNNVPDLNQAI